MQSKCNHADVVILMATYNGADFLEEQIRSIQDQEYQNWELLVRDDGSTDGTLKIIENYQRADKRIKCLTDNYGPQGSAKSNFAILSREALKYNYPYIFYADQDDMWERSKVSQMRSRFGVLEDRHGKIPLLLYSDLSIVDAENNLIHKSFMQFQGLKHYCDGQINILLTQNFVTGCAMAINSELLRSALPVPKAAIMHDWWFSLCAATVGSIEYMEHPLVKYRQHGKNSVGAKGYWRLLNPFETNLSRRWLNGRQAFLDTITQAKALHDHISVNSDSKLFVIKKMVLGYASLIDLGYAERLKVLKHYKIRRLDLIMNMAFILRVILEKKTHK